MEFGDFASIAFVVIILASFFWPTIRGRGKRGAGSTMGGPKDFSQSGGFRQAPVRARRVAPEQVATSNGTVIEDVEAVHRLRVEDRLTRDEMVEPEFDSASAPTAEERGRRRPLVAGTERAPTRDRGDQIRAQLEIRDAAQVAFVVKEVFDRPVGMRNESRG